MISERICLGKIVGFFARLLTYNCLTCDFFSYNNSLKIMFFALPFPVNLRDLLQRIINAVTEVRKDMLTRQLLS